MGSNWSTQESLAWKPNWWANSSLYFSRYSNKELKITLSNIFWQIGNKLADWSIVIDYLSPSLWVGHIFDFIHKYGNILWLMQFLNITESGFIIAKSNIFNILIDI